jgi:UDPglucose--hexose-1-phosphate uridylyltransferase
MPQYRQDFVKKEWVIIAPERAKRPDQFRSAKDVPPLPPQHDDHCPFCKGNEGMTPGAVLTVGGNDWRIRVVPNKFAAVNPSASSERHDEGRFLSADGFGVAEVVIETPRHDGDLSTMSHEDVKGVLTAYRDRYQDLAHDKRIDLITIFRNHGVGAGTSLVHPHSQIIATPIITPHIRHMMQQAEFYHDTYGKCPFCVMMHEELEQGQRIVAAGERFVAFCPYASRAPFEMRILPTRHSSQFSTITDNELDELSGLVRTLLGKLRNGLHNPDYNMIFRSSPIADGELDYDHWRLSIVPRLTTPAGFELGSGIYINIMPPEDAAAFLREASAE